MRKNLLIFCLLSFLLFLLSLISLTILNTNKLLISSLSEQLTNEQIQNFLNIREKWQWVSYIFIPILLLIKVSIISAILDVGCFFFEIEVKYKKLFNIVVKAEFVFLGVIVLKTGWFLFFMPNYTLEDLQYFYPLVSHKFD